MTPEEWADISRLLAAAWPGSDFDEYRSEVYRRALEDLAATEVRRTLEALSREEESLPSPALIRRALDEAGPAATSSPDTTTASLADPAPQTVPPPVSPPPPASAPAGRTPANSFADALGRLPRPLDIPLDVWLVIALFGLAGGFLVVNVLRLLPDVFEIFGAGFLGVRFGLLVLILLLQILAIGVALLVIAALIYRRSRVGRGLAYVAAGVVTLSAILGEDSGGWEIAAMVISIAAAAILAFSPGSREHFGSPFADPSARPISVVVACVLLAVVAWELAVVGLVYLLVADIEAKWAILGIILIAAAAGTVVAVRRLGVPDQPTRLVLSVCCGVLLVLMLVLGERTTGMVVPVGIVAAIPAALWLPPDSRRWFGDSPIAWGQAVKGSAPTAAWTPGGRSATQTTGHQPITHKAGKARPAEAVEQEPQEPGVIPPVPARQFPAPETAPPALATSSVAVEAPGVACASCATPLGPDDRFCGECGSAVLATTRCGSCDTVLLPEDRFCPACGTPVGVR